MGFTVWQALVKGEWLIWFGFFLLLLAVLLWMYHPAIIQDLFLPRPKKAETEVKP
jgi:hypothetical protein